MSKTYKQVKTNTNSKVVKRFKTQLRLEEMLAEELNFLQNLEETNSSFYSNDKLNSNSSNFSWKEF